MFQKDKLKKEKIMNRLKNEKSPYLLQHANNPVDWYPWSEEAFEKAANEDKMVFLSIGYSTCHWCHIMAHESFEDEEVAEILRKNYICIKVDREERPDIDAVYMEACQAVNGTGGWPLTCILTSNQNPFFVGTYFPKYERYGQPGLIDLLNQISLLWDTQREILIQSGEQIANFILSNQTSSYKNIQPVDRMLSARAFLSYKQQFDKIWGGFGREPKFPVPHNLLFLIRYSYLENNEEAMQMVEKTLISMAKGGIFDQIGGGFSRYSTDEKWLVPHFEKMLYDNALLSIAYLEAFQMTGKTEYVDIAKRTLDYVLRELTGKNGEFFCGQDADSDGIEGKYYVFSPDEIQKVLGEKEGRKFCRQYNITDEGNFEEKSIPNQIYLKSAPSWKYDDRLKQLYHYRLMRTKLHKDDKVILSWNGLMIMAMAKAAQVLGDTIYLEAAVKAEKFISENMTDLDGTLFHRWRENEAAFLGQLDDYAAYGLALLELYEMKYEPHYLVKAAKIADRMTELFEDFKEGGYFITASNAEKLITRPKEIYDGALPSGNSMVALLAIKLEGYTAEMKYQEMAKRQIHFLERTIYDYPSSHSFGLLAFLEVLYPTKELIYVSREEKVSQALEKYKKENLPVNTRIVFKSEERKELLTEVAPFTENYPIPEAGDMYYLCQNGICQTPEMEFEKLKM